MGAERLSTECAVVGAGMSGLAAATTLHGAGVDTVVVEARDRVGGRAWSVRLDDGSVLDLGGQWIGATHHRLKRLGEAHGATTFRQYGAGPSVIRAGGRTVRFRGKVPLGLGPIAIAALAAALLRLDRMARSVSVDEPWTSRRADEWDSQTLETWIRRNVRNESARAICRGVLGGIFAADPGDVSLLHALVYIRAGEGLDNLTGTVGAAQDASFCDGMQALAEHVADDLDGRVHLGHPVRQIRHRADRVTVVSDTLAVECDRVIVAVPPALTARIEYDPPLPGARDQLTQRVPQGSAIKCFAVYDTPFWRDGGACLVLDTEGPISMVIDGSPDGGRVGILIAFYEGRSARRAGLATSEHRRAEVVECLTRHFGDAARTPRHYRDQDWAQEPFTRGCYAGVMPPGAWTSFGPALREPVGRIHWAGTETATEWTGYYEGALQAGERAASEVLAATRART